MILNKRIIPWFWVDVTTKAQKIHWWTKEKREKNKPCPNKDETFVKGFSGKKVLDKLGFVRMNDNVFQLNKSLQSKIKQLYHSWLKCT